MSALATKLQRARLAGWVFGAWLAILGPVAAAAQPAPRSADDVTSLLKQANDLFEREEYQRALDGFRRAYDLRPTARTRALVGRSLAMLGRCPEAVDEIERALQLDDGTLLGDERREAQEIAQHVRPQLKLKVNVTGARVYVDGNAVASVDQAIPLPPGRHEVVAIKDGYAQASSAVDVAACSDPTRESVLALTLIRIHSRLSVVVVPEGSAVRIDDRPASAAPVTMLLAPGTHEVRASKPGFASVARQVVMPSEVVQPDQAEPEVTLRIQLASTTPVTRKPAVRAKPQSKGWSPWRIASAGGAGVGLAGIVAGSILGLNAGDSWDSAQGACPQGACTDPRDIAAGADAGNQADRATAAFVAGGTLLAASIVVWLVADD